MCLTLAMFIGALAMVCGLSAVVHFVLLVPHRRDDITLVSLIFLNYLVYAQGSWKPSGHRLHRRLMASGIAFFACVVAMALLSAVGAR